jgi:hypothetical protein
VGGLPRHAAHGRHEGLSARPRVSLEAARLKHWADRSRSSYPPTTSELSSPHTFGALLQLPLSRGRSSTKASGAHGSEPGLAYDLLFDACANGPQLKFLTLIDEYSRECLAIELGSQSVVVDVGFPGVRLTSTAEARVSPRMMSTAYRN